MDIFRQRLELCQFLVRFTFLETSSPYIWPRLDLFCVKLKISGVPHLPYVGLSAKRCVKRVTAHAVTIGILDYICLRIRSARGIFLHMAHQQNTRHDRDEVAAAAERSRLPFGEAQNEINF